MHNNNMAIFPDFTRPLDGDIPRFYQGLLTCSARLTLNERIRYYQFYGQQVTCMHASMHMHTCTHTNTNTNTHNVRLCRHMFGTQRQTGGQCVCAVCDGSCHRACQSACCIVGRGCHSSEKQDNIHAISSYVNSQFR